MSTSGQVEVELDLTGASLGAWRVEQVVGEGAMARVYRARHLDDGRVSAVKVLRAQHTQDAELVERFVREARAVHAIRHRNIVEVFEMGKQRAPDGTTASYQVMELLEGQLLSDVIDAGPLPLKRAVRVVQQVALALHAAHQVGVVHRDIKPENIFLTAGDTVKVLDFGMAKLLKPLGELPKSGTMEGVVLGTPEYMAPEQALGRPVDLRADVYAAGLMLYELLVGERPFQGETFGKLLVQITSKPTPRLPATLRSGEAVPPGLADLVERCLAKDPDQRLPSAEALARGLEAFGGDPVPDVLPKPLAPPTRTLSLTELEAIRPSRTPVVVVVALGVALLVALLLVMVR